MEQEDFTVYNGEGTTLRKAQLRMVEILVEIDAICEKHKIEYWLDYGTLLGAVRHGGFIPWDDDIDIAVRMNDYIKLCKILKTELPEHLVFQDETTDKRYFLKFAKVRDKNSHLYDPIMLNRNIKEHGLYIDIFPVEKLLSKGLKKFIEATYSNAYRRYKRFYKGNWMFISGLLAMPIASAIVGFVRLLSSIIPSNKYFTACGVTFYYNHIYKPEYIFPCKKIMFEGHEFKAPVDTHSYLKNIFGDYMKIPLKEKRITHSVKIDFFQKNYL